MKWITEVDKSELIKQVSVELQKCEHVKPTEWSKFVRTGAQKERPPVDPKWWYVRAASLLLKTAKMGPIGVSKLRTEYGGKKRRGHQPAEFRRASGSIIRKLFQQLEKEGFVKQTEKGVHKGRVLTPKGMSYLNQAAKMIAGPAKKPREEKNAEPRADPKPKGGAKAKGANRGDGGQPSPEAQ
jgi:small subunit ribosomal protein S19e